jgi:type II secretory pathway pseudopilin PulG
MTLTELMVAGLLIGFTLAVVGELVSLNTFASTKLTNKVDGQVGCSRACRAIAENVRQARIIGNVYGRENRNSFPDTTNANDPSNLAPEGGWPTSPWPQPPYVLDGQTLILQLPVYYSHTDSNNPLNGFPLRLKKDQITTGVPAYSMEYVDTVVYKVIADSAADASGQYILQVARFSGRPKIDNCTLRPAINPPQTILKGIVGPITTGSGSAMPTVFRYLSSPVAIAALATPTDAQVNTLAGVSVDIEAQVPNSNNGANKEITTVHHESFIKAAKNLRLSNE